MAREHGAHVIGTVSTEAKAQVARDEAGADEMILYTKDDFVAAVKHITDGKGVNVVYDSVGKDTFDGSLEAWPHWAIWSLRAVQRLPAAVRYPAVGRRALAVPRRGPSVFNYTSTREELLAPRAGGVRHDHEGRLKLHIDRTYPLEEAAEAHRRHWRAGGRRAKLLLIP